MATRRPVMPTVFVTATDTSAGKTFAACALLRRARAEGLRALGCKPVASGSEPTPRGLRNDDALALMEAAGEATDCDDASYARVNPYCFEPPIAPHLAAQSAGRPIDRATLDAVVDARATVADWLVVEGAGGWRVPLADRFSFSDWVTARRWPVLLVVGMRLGCINHALLSAEAIAREGLLLGWIANRLPPEMPYAAENLATLRASMPAPCLGEFAAGDAPQDAAAALDWPQLRARCAARFTPVVTGT